MDKRVVTAIIGIPLLLVCCYIGGWLMLLLCGLLAAVGMVELCGLLERRGIPAYKPLAVLAALVLTLCMGLAQRAWWPFAVAVLTVAVAYAIYTQLRDIPLGQGLCQALAALYVGVGFGSLLLLRFDSPNWTVVLLAFLNVWVTDTAAYEVGRRFGRNKLAPSISPNKTWEGTLAGLACAMVVCGFYMLVVLHIPFIRSMGWALLFSAVAQIGDLLESSIKRWAGVKDSGNLFPGHGGVLDRFDSLLLSCPCIALLVLPALL